MAATLVVESFFAVRTMSAPFVARSFFALFCTISPKSSETRTRSADEVDAMMKGDYRRDGEITVVSAHFTASLDLPLASA